MIVLSSATTGRPAASASETSSWMRMWRATLGTLVREPRLRGTCSSPVTRPICSSRSRCSPAARRRSPCPERHDVLGTPLQPPFPEGFETAVFGLGCFWGAERVFWKAPGVYTTAVGYAGGADAEPDLRGGVLRAHQPHRGRARRLRPRRRPPTRRCCKLFWENHDPTQGMRQGNDVGTQYRSAIYATTPEQLEAAEGVARDVPEAARRVGLRRDHDRDRRGRAVLLRRGLPPAVPGQEPERLLRARRHRRLVPDRHGRHGRLGPGERRHVAAFGGALHELGEAALARRLPLGARDPVHGRAPVGARPRREVRARRRVGGEHRRVGLRQRVGAVALEGVDPGVVLGAALERGAAGAASSCPRPPAPGPSRCSPCSRCCAACAA